MGRFQSIREALVLAFPPPAIRGLGVAGGFEMKIEDRTGVGLGELQQVVGEMVSAANGQTSLAQVQSTFRAGVPQIYVDIDRVKAKSLKMSLEPHLQRNLQRPFDMSYVNDSTSSGKTYQVQVVQQ